MTSTVNFATLLTRYFTQRLIKQRSASPHTIRSYRDTFHLLLLFAKTSLGKEPSQLTIEQIDAPLVSSFLDDLQNRRGIGARSRNLRLTAIRSLFALPHSNCRRSRRQSNASWLFPASAASTDRFTI
jgi:site-specific recombinase XerC